VLESRNLFQSPVIWTTLILNMNLRTWLFFFIALFQVCIHSCWPGFGSTMLWVFLTMSTESSSWTSRVSVAGGAASSWLPSVFQLWTCQRAGLMAYNIKMPLICCNLPADKMQYNVKSLCLMPCSVMAQHYCWAVVLIDTDSGRGALGTLNVLF